MKDEIKLIRKVNYPQINRAIIKEDGIHLIEHDGTIGSDVYAPNLESMNKKLKELGFKTFEVVDKWPDKNIYY